MVNDFAKVQGEDVCLGILHNIRKQVDARVSNGVPAKGAVTLFKELAEHHVAKKAMNAKEDAKRAERQVSHDAYYATKKKGYVPNKDTILAQLEELYADSKISIEQYNFGIKGLECVHGLVAMQEDVVDDTFGF
jgi:hypothetical protein